MSPRTENLEFLIHMDESQFNSVMNPGTNMKQISITTTRHEYRDCMILPVWISLIDMN